MSNFRPSFTFDLGALITALVAYGLGLLTIYFSNRRGNWIILYRLTESPLIEISESVRKSLDIRYKNQPVEDIVIYQFEIYNKSNGIIRDINISIRVSTPEEEIQLLEVQHKDKDGMTISGIRNNTIELTRLYLNPIKKYKDEYIELVVFANTELEFSVEGGGVDWGVKLREHSGSYSKTTTQKWIAFSILFLIGAIIGILIFRNREGQENLVLLLWVLGFISLFAGTFSIIDYREAFVR